MQNKYKRYVLIGEFIDGTLDEEGERTLLSVLRTDKEFGNLFRRNVRMDIYLKMEAAAKNGVRTDNVNPNVYRLDEGELLKIEQSAESETIPSSPSLPQLEEMLKDLMKWEKESVPYAPKLNLEPEEKGYSLLSRLLYCAGGTVAALFLIFVVTITVRALREEFAHENELQPIRKIASIAKVTNLIDPVWAAGERPFKRGQELVAGKINLKSGFLQLRFHHGAELILEGPNDFLIVDEMNVFCGLGKLNAFCPATAANFTVTTPSVKFIDRGTEFSIDAQSEETVASVYSGSVEAHYNRVHTPFLLKQGESLFQQISGRVKRGAAVMENHVSRAAFSASVEEYTSHKLKARTAREMQWDNDPGLIVRCRTDEFEGDRFRNRSLAGSQLCPVIFRNGGKRTEGRFVGTNAIQFDGKKEHLSVGLTNTFQSMTIDFSVRIDELKNLSHVLVMSEDFFTQAGTLAWQLTREGETQLIINHKLDAKNSLPEREVIVSPVCFSSADYGTWCHFTLVIDANQKKITQYKDGVPFAVNEWNHVVPLRPGNFFVGNTSVFGRMKSNSINGAIEEFSIFDRPLTHTEINSLPVQ